MLYDPPRAPRAPAPHEEATPPRRLQILGERCSGTNFVSELLCRNLGLERTEAVGFKHWFVGDGAVPNDVLVVVVERRADDWLRSLHRQPWHAHPSLRNLPLHRFARAEWHCVWDDDRFGINRDHPRWGTEMMHERDPQTGRRFANPLAMRRAKHADWRRVIGRARHGEWLRYEEVADDPVGTVKRIAQGCGLFLPATIDPVKTYKGQAGRPFTPKSYAPLDRETLALVAQYA